MHSHEIPIKPYLKKLMGAEWYPHDLNMTKGKLSRSTCSKRRTCLCNCAQVSVWQASRSIIKRLLPQVQSAISGFSAKIILS